MDKFNPAWLKAIPSSVIINLSTAGPVGLWGKAPGTNGTIIGVLLYTLVFHQISFIPQVILALGLIYLAIVICGEGERRLFKRDPGEMILDEIVAVPVCFIGLQDLMAQTGYVWLYMLAGFGVFRFFDILKPLGINKLQYYPSGLGVVLDDIAAAVATHLVLLAGAYAWINLT